MTNTIKKEKMYYHVLEDSSYGNIGWHGYFESKEEADKVVKKLSDFFPKYYYYIEIYKSKKEPYTVTI